MHLKRQVMVSKVVVAVINVTLTEILNKEHVPTPEVLVRLADAFEPPPLEVLCMATALP